jgi:glycosyltransferase involved in cell wall biosynthesis
MNERGPKVAILLATFNGEKYLLGQLKSLESQKDVTLSVFANDDGSTDQTQKILNAWFEKGVIKEITYTNGVGSTKAFQKLLEKNHDFEYIAFCDQDDVWESNKLIDLIREMDSIKTKFPQLAFSRRTFIDSKNNVIGSSKKLRKAPSFANALVENIAPGNTILLNKEAATLVNLCFTNETCHYDSFTYLIISAFGRCIFVDKALVRYRIHSENSIGLRKFDIKSTKASIICYIRQWQILDASRHKVLEDENKAILNSHLNILEEKRTIPLLRSIYMLRVIRQSRFDTYIFKIILFFVLRKIN